MHRETSGWRGKIWFPWFTVPGLLPTWLQYLQFDASNLQVQTQELFWGSWIRHRGGDWINKILRKQGEGSVDPKRVFVICYYNQEDNPNWKKRKAVLCRYQTKLNRVLTRPPYTQDISIVLLARIWVSSCIPWLYAESHSSMSSEMFINGVFAVKKFFFRTQGGFLILYCSQLLD